MAGFESIDGVMEALQGVFRDEQGLKVLLELLADRAMREELSAHLNAARHQRSDDRRGYRNGSKPRTMATRRVSASWRWTCRRCGTAPPGRTIPASLIAGWQRSERALLVACAEMYFQGVSTRNVQEVLSRMCGAGTELSAMTVSRVAQELDERLATFRCRRLDHTSWPYLTIDARYEKVRVDGRVVSQAVLVTAGYDAEGRRHVLDWRVCDSESEQTWGELLRSLKDRGLSGVKLVVSDAHAGIRAAVARHLQGCAWQRCQVHFKRQIAAKVSYKQQKELMKDVRAVFAPQEKRECLLRAAEAACKWEGRYPAVGRMLREELEDCLTVLGFPAEHRLRLTSTNMLENLMKRLKKRTRVVGVFPNRGSCDRLIGAMLLEVHETWQTEERRLINMDLTMNPAA